MLQINEYKLYIIGGRIHSLFDSRMGQRIFLLSHFIDVKIDSKDKIQKSRIDFSTHSVNVTRLLWDRKIHPLPRPGSIPRSGLTNCNSD